MHLLDASAGYLACETNSDRVDANVRSHPGLLATPRASGPGLTPALPLASVPCLVSSGTTWAVTSQEGWWPPWQPSTASNRLAKYTQQSGYREGPAAKWWEIFIQKARGSTAKGTARESFSSFRGLSLNLLRSSLPGGVILSKGKLEFYIPSMRFFLFMFILCDVSFQSKCVLDSHGKLLRSHNL